MRVVNRSGKSGRDAVKVLSPYLDDRFTLAHHVRLRGVRKPIDAVLVGPQGVTVLALADEIGRVRCLGDNWYVWDQNVQNFDVGSHNPIKKALADRAAMEAHVAARQMGSVMPVDGAVMVPDSRAQVEYMQPAAPVLAGEKIGEFAAQIASQRELIEWNQADELLKSLGVPPLGIPWRQLDQPVARAQAVRSHRLGGLTRQQIMILAALAVADLLVLIGGLALVLLQR